MKRRSPPLYLGLATCALAIAAAAACSSDGDTNNSDAGVTADGGMPSGGTGGPGAGTGGSDAATGNPGGGSDAGSPGGSSDSGTQGGGSDAASDAGAGGGTDGGTQPEGGATGGAPEGGATGGGAKTTCSAPTMNATVGNACKNSAPPAVKITPVVTGLALPVYVTQAPGDKTRLYVVEQRGKIKVVVNGKVEATPFLDITSKVVTAGEAGLAGEQGLLGMAFDPNYATTGRFWVKYNKTGTARGDDTISMFKATPGGNADPASEKVLTQISAPHPESLRNHNGGMLAFGPDGCLYISYGDGGGSGDPSGNGQKVSDIFADILRIDVENFPAPAAGNPQVAGANPHLWSYGLRNAWRFSFDREKGDMYIGDVGQNSWEEVNVEPKGVGGRNYGWNVVEGNGHCYPSGTNCDQNGKTLPATEYANPPGTGQASVIGGYVYRGKAIPGLVGRYIYADSYSRELMTFVYSGEMNGAPKVCDEAKLSIMAPGNPYSFGEDLDGELYMTTANGGLYKFEPG